MRQNLKKPHGYTLGTMPEPVIELLTRNPDLLKRHETEIPVLRIDGEAKDFWRINPKRMRKILDKKLAR